MLPSDIELWFESRCLGFVDASPTKEAHMAVAIPVNAEEAKHVVDKTQLEAIGKVARDISIRQQTFQLWFQVTFTWGFGRCVCNKGSSSGKTHNRNCRGSKVCRRQDTARGYW